MKFIFGAAANVKEDIGPEYVWDIFFHSLKNTGYQRKLRQTKFLNDEIYNFLNFTRSNTSCLEAHAGFFRLLMKGIFDP